MKYKKHTLRRNHLRNLRVMKSETHVGFQCILDAVGLKEAEYLVSNYKGE